MMVVIHIKHRKRTVLLSLTILLLTATLAAILPGCRDRDRQPIRAETEEQRIAYLTSLGWTTAAGAVETLDLLLPEKLEGEWEDYAALQEEQGFPFSDFAGKTVRRYTYSLTNHPQAADGVQANLYVCDGQLIGGDVISTGQDGFRAGLAFPQQ